MSLKKRETNESEIQSNLGRMKKNRVIWIAIIIALVGVAVVAIFAKVDHDVVAYEAAEAEAQSELVRESEEAMAAAELAQSMAESLAASKAETEKATEDPFKDYVSPIDFDSLRALNPDVIAWLSIPGTNIEYPILRSKKDDTFYLNHNIDKQEDRNGALYIEYKYNNDDFSDPVTVVYGHNMASGQMFGLLQETYSKGFEGRDKAIVYLPDRERTYQLFAALPVGAGHLLNGKDMDDEGVYAHFVSRLLNSGDFDANVVEGSQITIGERILILSTCIGNQPDKRFIVAGKEIGPTAIEFTERETSEELLNLGLLFPNFIITQETQEEDDEDDEMSAGKTIIQQYNKIDSDENSHVQEEDTFVWTPDPDDGDLGASDVLSPKTGK